MGDYESRNPTRMFTNLGFYCAVFWNNSHLGLRTWQCEKLPCHESFTMALSHGRGWWPQKWRRPPNYSRTEVENGYSWLQVYLYLLSVPTLACYRMIFTFTLLFSHSVILKKQKNWPKITEYSSLSHHSNSVNQYLSMTFRIIKRVMDSGVS
jgi:hypothetical protein